MKKKIRVVISGVGIVSPFGVGNKVFWNGIKSGKSSMSRTLKFSSLMKKKMKTGEVKDFDIKDHLQLKGLRHLSKSTEFALVASKLALDDGKVAYPLNKRASESCGVALGTVNGTLKDILSLHHEILVEGPRGINPFAFPNISPNSVPSHVSMKFNITGFNACVISEASTGMDAVFYAANMIKEHGYKMGLSGASESLCQEIFDSGYALRTLAGTLPGTKEISCPYDARRNGVIMSEGCSVFLLEEMEHALKRKATIYAEIKGFGASFDCRTKKGYCPDAKGAIVSMQKALDDAGCSPGDIDFIMGSATSRRGSDRTEVLAVKRVFEEKAKEVPITSIKGALGYSFGASSSFDIAAALFSLKSSTIPPTLNYRSSDAGCQGLNIVSKNAVKKKVNKVLINSFSTGGFNSALIIERFRGKK
ncbi:MAG: beta-ketoacyl-[acyl-carrier-protein] synthase family protein [Candidatus Aadella gelida]|nr:beta-ketoacyl-[acyl-carrier-protein] synthase family protein [Candidatus Aadella gelida]